MANVLAVISKAIFEKTARGLGVGDVHPLGSYDSNPKAFEALGAGDKLFVVTARPGDQLWLVALLHDPKLARGKWVATPNQTPITDLTSLVSKLRFASGTGIKAKPGQLGMSLQTPRALTDDDGALITTLLGTKPKRKLTAKVSAAIPAPDSPDDDALLVYADLLIEQGDPRGELVHIQHRLASKPKDKKLLAAEAALLKKHAAQLLGPLAKRKKKLTWRLGFLDSAVIDPATPANVAELLAHPSARYLRHLELDMGHDIAPAVILQLAKAPHPTLRSLVLTQGYSSWDNDDEPGDYPTYSIDYGKHAHKQGDALWAAVPNLEKLTITGFSLFHTLALPALEELVVREGYPFCPETNKPWQLPKLRRIEWELQCDDTGTGVDWSIDTLAPIWKSKLPALRQLDVSECHAVGYLDYEANAEDSDDEDAEEIDDYCGWALRRDRGFKKLAAQLDELVLPEQHLKSKPQIARWLKEG